MSIQILNQQVLFQNKTVIFFICGFKIISTVFLICQLKIKLLVQSYYHLFIITDLIFKFKMDYQHLYTILPKVPSKWTISDVAIWLNFINLQALAPRFNNAGIDGSCIHGLELQDLENELEVKSNITKKKLLKWIKGGLNEFSQFVDKKNIENKWKKSFDEPSLKRNETSMMRERIKCDRNEEIAENKNHMGIIQMQQKKKLVISPYEGQNASFFCVQERGCKIGRSKDSNIPVFEETVEQNHATIFFKDNNFYLMDIGSRFGTYIKVRQRQVLMKGMIIEMGSYEFEILDVGNLSILVKLTHSNTEIQQKHITINLDKSNKNSFSIGRKINNQLYLQDHHLSTVHAKIFLLNNQFILEDMSSTNGTWIRLNRPSQYSDPVLLQNKMVFKIGSTSTYVCKFNLSEPMAIQKQNTKCIICKRKDNDSLLNPCKHNISCISCATNLKMCPVCQIEVEQVIKIFI